jgi:putative transcriptional regulator
LLEADGAVSIKQGRRWEAVVPTADLSRVDATTEEDIARQQAEDDAEAARDSAAWAGRVRRRTGLSQAEFARRIGISTVTVRQWERDGVPYGMAGTLLRLIDRAPEAARAVLAAK